MKRLICRLLGHRWKDVRVIKSLDLRGTDGRGNPMFTANDVEWHTRCVRCGKTEQPSIGDVAASSFGFKPSRP